jgi:TBC1 domain family member 10
MNKNYKKIRERCRKGIPSAVRAKAWFYLSGGKSLLDAHPNLYQELLEREGDPQIIDEIKRDQHRQFPLHEMFIDEDRPGQKELFNVLKAYSILNPETGFCQAQAPIAAFLLMHLPAEQAFWSFVSISDKYLKDYFSPGMAMLQRDAKLFMALLKKTSPSAHRHLIKSKVEPLMFMTDWFLCAMTRTLKWDTLLRVWDCFLCEGIKVIFKVSLVITGASLQSHKVRKNNKELCDTISILRQPKEEYLDEDFIMHHITRLNITVDDFITEHKRIEMQMRKEQQQNMI